MSKFLLGHTYTFYKTIKIGIFKIILVVGLVMATSISCFAGEGWQANIIVKSGNASNKVTFGQNGDATDFKDGFFDVPALMAGSLRAGFMTGGEVLWQDIRAFDDEDKEWQFSISSSSDEDIRISWDRFSLPDGLSMMLIDNATGNSVNMKLHSYFLLVNNKFGEFRIKASREMIKER